MEQKKKNIGAAAVNVGKAAANVIGQAKKAVVNAVDQNDDGELDLKHKRAETCRF